MIKKTVAIDYLARKLGIAREQGENLPETVLTRLIESPREGLQDLFDHLNRKRPSAPKLNQYSKELDSALRSALLETQEKIFSVTQAPSFEKEKNLDTLIESSEQNMIAFGNRVRDKLATVTPPAYLNHVDLLAPFETIAVNRDNPDRNMVRRYRQIQSGEKTGTIGLADPRYFFYDLKEGRARGEGYSGYAAFSPHQRIMMLPAHHDSALLSGQLVHYHETRHANQDAVARLQRMNNPMAMKAYLDFFIGRGSEKPKVNVIDEATAFSYELEVLNILADCHLQNGKIPSVNALMSTVKAAPADRDMLEMLLEFARNYYPEGMQNGQFSKRYIDFIADAHKKNGYDVYIPTTTGRLQQI